MTVIVFGSLNMDLVVQTPRLPHPGETLLGSQFATIPGGKGANQAVAVARQGVPTIMVGRVGGDGFGHTLRQGLATAGIETTGIATDDEAPTGIAAIAVAATGENHIIVVPGANGRVGRADLQRLEAYLPTAQWLLMQFELPLPTVIAAAHLAQAAGVRVMLDPAPVQPFNPADLYPQVDILTPNQGEAAQLVGFPVETIAQAKAAIAHLQRQGAKTVIITLGAQGVVCGTPNETFHHPALPVTVVDTVAAGDAFNGGLAVALAEGKPLQAAIAWATATAAYAVTQAGAQPSLPGRSQVAQLLALG